MNNKLTSVLTHSAVTKILIGLMLVICTVFVYWNLGAHDFINFDDNKYITDNPIVKEGISLKNIFWAFGFSAKAIEFYWHPLTWISHMIDCQLFGLDAGAHHLMNLGIHIANTLLLFFVFFLMTNKKWESFFVAALFALHPINVDSVAWIAERKNVLSSFFWMLTMLAYVYYARKPNLKKYVLVIIPLIFGMISKPMLITLPCALLLLDFWPLNRIRISSAQPAPHKTRKPPLFRTAPMHQLVLEKLPLLVIVLFFTVISIYSINLNQQLMAGQSVPLLLRVENAAVTYVKYIGKILWPQNFAVYYPFPDTVPLWQVSSAGLILTWITAIAFILVKKYPYIIVGWLWYLGTLFPVSGIHQHARWPEMADRWAYIPAIGLFIIISWGGSALLARLSRKKIAAPLCAAVIVFILIIISRNQLTFWKNSITLFTHALDVTKNNYLAHFNIGTALAAQGKMDAAIEHYLKSLEIEQSDEVHNNLGRTLAEKGRMDAAIEHFNAALAINPKNPRALNNLGIAYVEKQAYEEAIALFKQALNESPDNSDIEKNLANALGKIGKYDESISHFNAILLRDSENAPAQFGIHEIEEIRKTHRMLEGKLKQSIVERPDDFQTHYDLGAFYQKTGRLQQAIHEFEVVLSMQPDHVNALFSMAASYHALARYDTAETLFKRILRMQPDNYLVHYNLACVYSRSGKTDDALQSLKNAVIHGYKNWNGMQADEDLNAIKQTPYYRSLIEKKRHGR